MANAKKLLVIGLAAAAFVAASVWLFGYHGHIGGDGRPDTVGRVGLILFFPAIWLSETLDSRLGHTPSIENSLFLALACLQTFLLFWVLLWLASKLGQHNKHPQATPR